MSDKPRELVFNVYEVGSEVIPFGEFEVGGYKFIEKSAYDELTNKCGRLIVQREVLQAKADKLKETLQTYQCKGCLDKELYCYDYESCRAMKAVKEMESGGKASS